MSRCRLALVPKAAGLQRTVETGFPHPIASARLVTFLSPHPVIKDDEMISIVQACPRPNYPLDRTPAGVHLPLK